MRCRGGTFGISLGAGHISCEDADGNDCSGSGDLPAGGISLRAGTMLGPSSAVTAELWAMRHSEDGGAGPERGATLQQIRDVVARDWQGESHVGGGPFVEDAAARSSRHDVNRLSPIVIAVLVLVSAALLGSVTAAGLNLILTGLGVGLVMGAHGRFGEPLTIVSSSLPVMMVALGGAFGVHILAGFQRQQGTSRERASATLRELWLPVVLSGATTAVAFFALIVMPQVPMQRFGIIAGVGVLVMPTPSSARCRRASTFGHNSALSVSAGSGVRMATRVMDALRRTGSPGFIPAAAIPHNCCRSSGFQAARRHRRRFRRTGPCRCRG